MRLLRTLPWLFAAALRAATPAEANPPADDAKPAASSPPATTEGTPARRSGGGAGGGGGALPARGAPTIPPLPPEQVNALVLIEGDRGRGSGFLAKLRGQTFVVTNLHVLSGNKQFTVTGVDGVKYPPTGALHAAVGYDIAILRVPEAKFALEVLEDAHLSTNATDPVTVPGNAAGAGVATQTHGKLQGIGPKLIEVDAKFVKGNSGSPIIHRATGKVIGVATYTMTYRLADVGVPDKTDGAPLRETRWFGYRLDRVEQWEPLEWKKFSEEGLELAQIEAVTDALIGMLEGSREDAIAQPEVKEAYLAFTRDMENALAKDDERAYYAAVERFTNRLRTLSDAELRRFSTRRLYAYHADELKKQQEIRAAISQALRQMGEVYRTARRAAR